MGGYAKRGAIRLFAALADAAAMTGLEQAAINVLVQEARETLAVAVQQANWFVYNDYAVTVSGKRSKYSWQQRQRHGRRHRD